MTCAIRSSASIRSHDGRGVAVLLNIASPLLRPADVPGRVSVSSALRSTHQTRTVRQDPDARDHIEMHRLSAADADDCSRSSPSSRTTLRDLEAASPVTAKTGEHGP